MNSIPYLNNPVRHPNNLFEISERLKSSKALAYTDQSPHSKEFTKRSLQFHPPQIEEVPIHRLKQTFNHLYEFILQDEIIWSKKRGEPAHAWQPICFDGVCPVQIRCDGANLAIMDIEGRIHYKKILREWRGSEFLQNLSLQQSFEIPREAIDSIDASTYVYTDKRKRYNWKKKWFTLPVIHVIVNLFAGKRLDLGIYRAWSISHRGRWNDYYEDGYHQQSVCTGVTTLCALRENKKEILKFDPWSPSYCEVIIPVPETSTAAYEAENIDDSASMLMMIGYEIVPNPLGGVIKRLTLKTMLADIDIMGWNPGLDYDYFPNPQKPETRIVPIPQLLENVQLPKPEIIKHALPPHALLTQEITIMQTGQGNLAREMRIPGWNENLEEGYYKKSLNQMEWEFIPNQLNLDEKDVLPNEIEDPQGKFEPNVRDYSKLLPSKLGRFSSENVKGRLLNFGKGSFDACLELTIYEQKYCLYIHRKLGIIKKLLGFLGESYDLVVPPIYHQDKVLFELFKGSKVIPLTIKEYKSYGIVILESKNDSDFYLKFTNDPQVVISSSYNLGTIKNYWQLCSLKENIKFASLEEENLFQNRYKIVQIKCAELFADVSEAICLQEVKSAECEFITTLKEKGFKIFHIENPIFETAIALSPKKFREIKNDSIEIKIDEKLLKDVAIVTAQEISTLQKMIFVSAYVPNYSNASNPKDGDIYCEQIAKKTAALGKDRIQFIGINMHVSPEQWKARFDLFFSRGFKLYRKHHFTHTIATPALFQNEVDFIFIKDDRKNQKPIPARHHAYRLFDTFGLDPNTNCSNHIPLFAPVRL